MILNWMTNINIMKRKASNGLLSLEENIIIINMVMIILRKLSLIILIVKGRVMKEKKRNIKKVVIR